MTEVEILAVMRALIAFVCIPFAIRARMWLLTAGWVVALAVSVLFASGVGLVIVGILAVPFFGFFAGHTIYVTQNRRTEPYLRRRKSLQ